MERSTTTTNAPLSFRSRSSRSSGSVEGDGAEKESISAVSSSCHAPLPPSWEVPSATVPILGGAKQKAPSAFHLPQNALSTSCVDEKQPPCRVPSSLNNILDRISSARLSLSPPPGDAGNGSKDSDDFTTEDARRLAKTSEPSETAMPNAPKRRRAFLDLAPKTPSRKRRLLRLHGLATYADSDDSSNMSPSMSLSEFLSSVPPPPPLSSAVVETSLERISGGDDVDGTDDHRGEERARRAHFRIEPRFDSPWLARLGALPLLPVEIETLRKGKAF